MEYLRLAPDIDSDPDLELGGWCAARVYELLLKVSAIKDLRGRITPEFQNPGWLAKRWNLTAADLPGVSPEDFISNGVGRLLKVGKLTVEEGCWVIRGWAAFYGEAKTGSARTRDWRNRQAGRVALVGDDGDACDETSSQPSQPATPVTVTLPTPPTPHHPPTKAEAARTSISFAPGDICDRIQAAFLEVKGHAIGRWGPKDEIEIGKLLDQDPDEIVRRWRIALRRKSYPRCASTRELVANWDHYTEEETTGPTKRERDITRGTVPAETQDHEGGLPF